MWGCCVLILDWYTSSFSLFVFSSLTSTNYRETKSVSNWGRALGPSLRKRRIVKTLLPGLVSGFFFFRKITVAIPEGWGSECVPTTRGSTCPAQLQHCCSVLHCDLFNVKLWSVSLSWMCRLQVNHFPAPKGIPVAPLRIKWIFIVLHSPDAPSPRKGRSTTPTLSTLLGKCCLQTELWGVDDRVYFFFLRLVSVSARYFLCCIFEFLFRLRNRLILPLHYRIMFRKRVTSN